VRPAKEPPRTLQAPPPPPPQPEPEPDPEPEAEPAVPEGLLLNEPATDHGGQISDLIIDSPIADSEVVDTGDQLLGIERLGDPMSSSSDLSGSLDIQRGGESSSLDFEPMTVEGMEGGSGSLDFSVDPMSSSVDFSDDLIVSLPETDTAFNVLGSDAPEAADPSPLLDVPSLSDGLPLITPKDHSGDTLADLENRVLDDPENPDVHLELADKLLSLGESDRVAEELELALAGFEDRQDWTHASEMADRLVALMPDSIGHHQKRVELAYRTGDRGPLLEAYLGLGDALAKSGALDKAAAVYGRVIEHDPGNTRASAALVRVGGEPPKAAPPERPRKPEPSPVEVKPAAKTSAPPPRPTDSTPKSPATPKPTAAPAPAPSAPPKREKAVAASDDGFVDLGSMLREETNQRDTRMRVNRREPKDQDEQREFHEILEQFKRGIDENLDSDDYQSHYDLGVAFKEMGLLDEAIGEFQKALRASEGRLRTSEALGMAFFEKGQYAVCESVLRRAVDGLDGSDEAKIGLLYWLGRASEALGKRADAMASYERAVAVDIRFLDLSDRMHKLTAGRRS
jgi:tetratricopeptide (TPR) repeat protein